MRDEEHYYPFTEEPSFSLEDHGSLWLLYPYTEDVEAWLEEHISEDAYWFGPKLVIEPRYVEPILEALLTEGFLPSCP